ncbi:polyprenyl synthetase family protein, partial [Deinococcus pimensis]|uniref:polyprenyl synthetase family protein n=1 Tax=Deinococcus pimensis TaxID=309888 RepID=UPI0005EB9208
MLPDIKRRIDELLPRHHDRPEVDLLYRMMRDYPERGGKGIRGELVLLAASAYGARDGSDAWDRAAWLAATVELFQNWVLIHDDVEDDSEERRGRP